MDKEYENKQTLDAVNCIMFYEKFFQPLAAMNSILNGFRDANEILSKYKELLCKEVNLNHKRFREICTDMFNESFGQKKFNFTAFSDGCGFKIRIYNFSTVTFEGAHKFSVDINTSDVTDKNIDIERDFKIIDVFGSELDFKVIKLNKKPNDAIMQSFLFEFYSELPPMGFAEFNFSLDLTVSAYPITLSFNLPFENSTILSLVRSAKVWEELELPTSFLDVNNDLILSNIFKCAKRNDGYVLSLYNIANKAFDTIVSVNFDIDKAYLCNKSEDILHELKVDCGEIRLEFKPYETKYLKFTVLR